MPSTIKECQSHSRPAVVVFFVGGVTYGEIATIRLLGKLYRKHHLNSDKEIIIATTEIINGNTLIKQLIE